jgi:hypothetical protein
MKVTLTIHSVDRTWEVPITGSRVTLGRTDAADIVINDDDVSRVHASINRENDLVWIIDEGSTNGTFVNREQVSPNGTPLSDGAEIDLGGTAIVVSIRQEISVPVSEASGAQAAASGSSGPAIAIIAAAAGLLVILFVAIVIGLASRSSNDNGQIVVRKYEPPVTSDPTPSPRPVESSAIPTTVATLPGGTDTPNLGPVAPKKRYLAMTPEEQRLFVAAEAQHVARMIGNREGYAFTPEVVNKIKIWVDSYARRVNSPRLGGGCHWPRDDLTTLLERARTHAPLVVKSFNEKGLSPQVGLYLAMIEAEYCPCLSSGTGAKGMFQFVGTTARRYGVPFVTANSRDPASDDRCKVEIMAPIAAQYVKDLITMFGTGPLSVPLAIASYNEGEGGLSSNLQRALNAARTSDNPERSFWTMVANADMMSDQFQREAIKYVPHFFGAAIVGENPRVFGVDLEPVSSYTQSNPAD